MTVQQLADQLDLDEKLVRRWLREDFPELAPGKGGRWVVTYVMRHRVMMRELRR